MEYASSVRSFLFPEELLVHGRELLLSIRGLLFHHGQSLVVLLTDTTEHRHQAQGFAEHTFGVGVFFLDEGEEGLLVERLQGGDELDVSEAGTARGEHQHGGEEADLSVSEAHGVELRPNVEEPAQELAHRHRHDHRFWADHLVRGVEHGLLLVVDQHGEAGHHHLECPVLNQ